MELVKKYRVVFWKNNSVGFKYMFNDLELEKFISDLGDSVIEVIKI